MSTSNQLQPKKYIEDISFQPASIVSKQIIKKPNGNVTLFSFDEGENLSEHTSPFDALVYIVEGKMSVTIGGEPVEVNSNEYLVMPADIPHGLKALMQTKMLLTMIK
ncbi:MAG: cupin domain-containing protein [Ignavibacteriaceae bacterium]|nr:cupin domain-containing protein [Ignavibacteriaceae bacterium]HRI45732.1 cupin domain-containing protein [Ignavibacteriaceae bacterium]